MKTSLKYISFFFNSLFTFLWQNQILITIHTKKWKQKYISLKIAGTKQLHLPQNNIIFTVIA